MKKVDRKSKKADTNTENGLISDNWNKFSLLSKAKKVDRKHERLTEFLVCQPCQPFPVYKQSIGKIPYIT
jgi:hypothetical protein